MLQVAQGFPERVIAGGASGDRSIVHAGGAVADGDLSAHKVDDDGRNEEGTDAPVPLLNCRQMRFLESGESAHAGPDDHAGPLSERLVGGEPRIPERKLGRRQSELDEEVVAPGLFLVHELRGVEVLHFSGDPAG